MKSHSNTRKFTTSEEFWYLGEKYPLIITTHITQALVFNNALPDGSQGFYLHELNRKNAETFFLNWYKKQALQLFQKRVSNYASQAKLAYKSIELTSAESKWGSCSEDNMLMFNWRLIMAPVVVIDSVIFHELAHIMEKNHTKKFWRRLTMWCPDYHKHKDWLDRNGDLLHL